LIHLIGQPVRSSVVHLCSCKYCDPNCCFQSENEELRWPAVDSWRICCGATRARGGAGARGAQRPELGTRARVGVRGSGAAFTDLVASMPSSTSRCKFTAASLCFFPRVLATPHGEGSCRRGRGPWRVKDDDAEAGRVAGTQASPPCSCPGRRGWEALARAAVDLFAGIRSFFSSWLGFVLLVFLDAHLVPFVLLISAKGVTGVHLAPIFPDVCRCSAQ
jgi:hypothetical protein